MCVETNKIGQSWHARDNAQARRRLVVGNAASVVDDYFLYIVMRISPAEGRPSGFSAGDIARLTLYTL